MTATVHSLERKRSGAVSLKLYQPRWYQARLHREATRFNVWVCHRRFGKTVAVINEIIRELVVLGVANRERPRAAYIAPFHNQAKRIAWDYARHYSSPIPGIEVRSSDLAIDYPWGARLTLCGGDKPERLKGQYFDIAVVDETAEISPVLWHEVLRPTLADRLGRAIFIGTPRGRRNLFHRLFQYAQRDDTPEWSAALFTVDDTDALSDAELMRMRQEMPESKYRQEMLCDFTASVAGAYYAAQLDEAQRGGRVREVPYDRSLPVLTSWDFGIKDPTVVVYWQLAGAEIRCLGADAIADLSLPEIIAQVKTSRPYSYGAHYVPHDAAVRASEVYGAPQRVEIMAEHGFDAIIAPTKSLDDGIDAVRRGLPRVVFDRKGCEVLIEALSLYRSEYDELRGIHRPRPVRDWTTHYADAVRTLFQATDGRESGPEWGNASYETLALELERGAI